jgi:carboxymethylenebutenolidase
MCDDHYDEDVKEFVRRAGAVTRRRFGALSIGTGLSLALPAVAGAVEVSESDVDIKTADGTADAYFVRPASGTHPGVLIWPDIMGLRPAFRMMGKRLAEAGYSVLVPNPFYRERKAPVVPAGSGMQDEGTRKTLMSLMGSLTPDTALTDARAFVGFLDDQRAVDKRRKLGTSGYCMGGPFTLRTAAAFPDRIGAGASFHGAALVTDKMDSPHLLVPRITASYLIAIAESDDMREPNAKTALRQAFADARLPAEIEVYAGTMHGWCVPDAAVYNEAEAEKAWSRLLVLFNRSLMHS